MSETIQWLAGSPDDTFGVEEEFYLVDAATGRLSDRARDVVADADGPELEREVLRCSVESSTPACRDASECLDALERQRSELASRADALGLELHAAGVPPMLAREDVRGWIDRAHPQAYLLGVSEANDDLDIFACHGIHVHVGVTDFHAALRVMGALASQLPLVLALTANSRANAVGADCASLRIAWLLRSSTVGMTPRFTDAGDLLHAVQESGPDVSGHPRPRWLVSPVPHYGTVEVRAFDANADVRVALELAVVCRAIASAALTGDAHLRRPSEWIERKNLDHAWRLGHAATYLDAEYELRTVTSGWERLLELVGPFMIADVPTLHQRALGTGVAAGTRVRRSTR